MSEAERIAQIKDRVNATTCGSWEVLSREIVSSLPRWGKTGYLHATVMSLIEGREHWFSDEDAAFIEAAKEDMLWLLDQLSNALRAQENEPILAYDSGETDNELGDVFICSNCQGRIYIIYDSENNYCPKCGKPITFDEDYAHEPKSPESAAAGKGE